MPGRLTSSVSAEEALMAVSAKKMETEYNVIPIARSSNGRTADFESAYHGPNPCWAARVDTKRRNL